MSVLISPKTVGSKNHILGTVKLKPRELVEEHLHDYGEESIYVLSGSAKLTFNGDEEIDLIKGRAVLIPPGTYHKIENNSNDECEILFASSPLAPSQDLGHRSKESNVLPFNKETFQFIDTQDSVEYVPVEEEVSIFCRLSGFQNKSTPILLLHGNRDNHSHFAELQAALSKFNPVIAIDFRGHGLSSKTDSPMTVELMSQDIIKVIRHLGFKKVILVGHSLGASTSLYLSLTHSDVIEKMILMGAVASYRMKWKRPPVSQETYKEVIKESNNRAGPFFFEDGYEKVKDRVIQSWSSIEYRVHKNLIQIIHPDVRNLLDNISLPVLIIAGENDKSSTVEDANVLYKGIKNSELEVFPSTGHFMYLEKPQEIADRIIKFIYEKK